MAELTGRVALVTGASRGIGKAIALHLARAGLDVAVNYRSRPEEGQAVAAAVTALGRRGVAIQADVADAGQVTRLVADVHKALGPIDVLVNNAGSALPQKWEEIKEADWHQVLNNNLTSAFLMTQAVLPEMKARKWGWIVNIGSGAARAGGVVGVHYTAAKAGMAGLTRAYAKAVVADGVTVNIMSPALIDTEMRVGDRSAREKMIPMGRLGTVEECAEAVLMLVRNGYMTGQTIHLNGGMYYS
ncbi:MAG TPA: SDR family NAD(P)-dependent oxidoreductase [bacterium]